MAAEEAKVHEPEVVGAEANVTDLAEQEALRCKREIEGALDGMTKNFFVLAINLHKAYENDYAPQWGYDNFRSYVEGRLEMKYRRAAYLCKCGEAIQNLGLSEAQVRSIGWTKFKEIAPIMLDDKDKAPKLLQMAEDMSTRELQEALKEEEEGVSSRSGAAARPDVMRMSLKFEADAANIVSDGLKLAFGEIGSQDANQAINHIVSEWMMSKDAVAETASLQDWLQYLEKTYGVRLQKVEEDESLDALLSGGATQDVGMDDELDSLLAEGNDADVEDLLGD